ncbi:hypothetical protein PSTG_08083 [Puccinia striiformis f. sp. tritici PST-78]|uniref:Tet-like 2OG-Fe(II) oxygenase domain-containing protein n=1 Tax=Puccinia striiformis f. sp. tritici PST-78 TaxID=1165861 RepID=A0A0L0VI85_9BASI|nr:hypothetical protein PSTG_08083 [Puccinia striiformis f. sp. tritici PST-78]
MAHNKGYQKKRRNENCDRTKSKTRSFQVSLVDEPTALPQDDPNSTDTQILWSDRKLKPTKLYPCPTGVSITQKPTPDEIKAAQEIAREFHYYTEKKVVVMDRSKGFQVIALIKFTPLDQLSESEKLELNIIAKFLHWVRRYVDTSLDSFQLMGRYRHQATITESPEDYDTLMRNLAPCASDILGVIFKNHANVAFEDNREKIKDANIPAMAALEFDAPLSPNDSAPNLSFTRDGFFNKETGLLATDSAAADIEGGQFVLPKQRCGINFSKQNRLVSKTENTARDIESGEIMNRPSNQHKDMEDMYFSDHQEIMDACA